MTIHASLGVTAETLDSLIEAVKPHGHAPLRFAYDGRTTTLGYHVTEVKSAALLSLDCGANPERWSETVIQLWDVDDAKARMTVGKFLAILRKVQSEVGLDGDSTVVFEVGDASATMRLYTGGSVEVAGGQVMVALTPRRASCKPRERWLEESELNAQAGCCGSQPASVPCCG